ncbi:MAG: SCP-2 sterol transfer family protein [Firmicutes bacterium]|nr:SCP-2 sterol transfer family protein [Bacillota bacterium]
MTYEEIFEKSKERLLKAKTKDVKDFIAIQFNITGEGHGSFYAVIFDGKMDVQPYDYKDNDISVNVSGDELVYALENKTADKLGFYGNNKKITVLKSVLATIPKARKATEKTAVKSSSKPSTVKKAPKKK